MLDHNTAPEAVLSFPGFPLFLLLPFTFPPSQKDAAEERSAAPSKISFSLAFTWFRCHQTVQLRILWEAVLKWHKISGTPDQTLTCAYIGDIG